MERVKKKNEIQQKQGRGGSQKEEEEEDEESGKENKFKKLISETSVSHVCGWAEVRHGYMPVGRQEALIVPPRGVQVGPGAVGGVITPRSLVQHGDGQDEEEEEERRGGGGQGRGRWEHKMGKEGGKGKPKRKKMEKHVGGK